MSNTLQDYAVEHGTDKQKRKHNYVAIYDALFTPFRQEIFDLLEIGIYHGGSIRMWRDYFPNATIHGIDIRQRHINSIKDTERLVLNKVDQGSEAQLKEHAKKGPWKIVIDDGSHVSKHLKLTFDILWDTVEPGGYYIIEDTHCSYWKYPGKNWVEEGEESLATRMLRLADEVSSATYYKGAYNNYFVRHEIQALTKHQIEVEYIQFRMGMIIIKKRGTTADYGRP